MIEGYRNIGMWALYLSLALSIVTAVGLLRMAAVAAAFGASSVR